MIKHITAGILSGGRSSRMGQDKALLPYRQSSLLENLIFECSRTFETVFLSVDKRERYDSTLTGRVTRVVTDEIREFGPVEGIYQLLKAADTEYIFVMAVDMPYLEHSFMKSYVNLLEKTDDCLVLEADGAVQPMCAVYKKTVLPLLEQMRTEEIHKPRWLFERVNTHYVSAEAMGKTKELVKNINTREEYSVLLKEEAVMQKKAANVYHMEEN